MQINSFIRKVIVVGVSLFSLAILWAKPVYAQQSDNCIVIYGINYCPEKTPFAVGNVVIDDVSLMIILGVFIAVFAIVLNAVYLRSKLVNK